MVTLNYRSPQPPERPKRSIAQMILAQWPFFGGLGTIGLGLLIIRTTMEGHVKSGGRLGLYVIACGVALILYWAFANENSDYNF